MKYLLPFFLLITLSLTAQLERDSINVIYDNPAHYSYQLVDVDNDGDLDIITGKAGYNGNFVLYKNIDGQGTYTSGVTFGEKTWKNLFFAYTNFNMADMDNDGDLDLVSGNIVKHSKPYQENNGEGLFTAPDNIPDNVSEYFTNKQAIDDLDGDGWVDIILFDTDGLHRFDITINKNNGTDNDFTLLPPVHQEESSSTKFKAWHLFDFDNDGDKDIIYIIQSPLVSTKKELQIVLLEHNSDYHFTEISRLNIDTTANRFPEVSIESSLLNSDEFLDLIITYQMSDTDLEQGDKETDHLLLFQNENGSSQFTEVLNKAHYTNPVMGDIDNDGDIDLTVAYAPDGTSLNIKRHYYTWRNDGDFQFESLLIDETSLKVSSLNLADINTDGLLDLILFDNQGSFAVRWGEVDGLFSAAHSLNTFFRSIPALVSSDWDSDGDKDIISIGKTLIDDHYAGGIFWNKNDGEGHFEALELLHSFDSNLSYINHKFGDLNGDNLPDVIGVDIVHTAEGQQYLLSLYLSDSNGAYQDPLVVNSSESNRSFKFELADFDLDGDLDIIWFNTLDSQLWISWNTLTETGNFTSEPTNLSFNNDYFTKGLFVSDINNDQFPDLLLLNHKQLSWATKLAEGSLFSDFHPIYSPENFKPKFPQLHTKLDEDPYAEILFRGQIDNGSIDLYRSDYQADVDSFSTPRIIQHGSSNINYQINLLDFNEDGLLDIINHAGFSLNIPGSSFFTSPYIPTPFDEDNTFPFFYSAILDDINGDNENEIIAGAPGIVSYSKQFTIGKTLQGHIRWDESAQCQYDESQTGMFDWNIALTHEEGDQLINSNTGGHYAAFLPFNGEYTVTPIPPSGYWTICPQDSVLMINEESENPDSVHFSAEALVDCPLVVIDMSSTSISQCFGSSVSVSYYNAGTANAYEASIEITFDERLTPESSNIPWQNQTNTSLVFNFDQIAIGERGFININFEPDCELLILGEEICFEANISPAELCDEMLLNWSGANLEASSFCEDDQTAFRIINTGDNAMDMAETYQISIVNGDIILYLSNDVILDPGEADTILLPAMDDGFWHLAINQPQGHPFPEPISLLTNDCSFSGPTPPLVPNGDGDPFRESFCRTVFGPYDPNDKSATPTGIGELNEIEKNWELTYTIQFQNTGNAPARTVQLHDQLSEWLDLSSFKAVGASHAYDWAIIDNRQLIITFPNINLVDSMANEVASHGFFSFSIKPKSTIPVETVISNYAEIYFDLNAPIRTGTVFHQIRKPVHSAAIHHTLCFGDNYQGIAIFQDTILQETQSFMDYDSTTFYHISVEDLQSTIEEIAFETSLIWEGIKIENDTSIMRTYTIANGCDSLVTYQFTLVTGTHNLNEMNGYSLSPNPAIDFTILNIEASSKLPDVLELYATDGRLIKRWSPKAAQNGWLKVDLSTLASGHYILYVSAKGKKRGALSLVVR